MNRPVGSPPPSYDTPPVQKRTPPPVPPRAAKTQEGTQTAFESLKGPNDTTRTDIPNATNLTNLEETTHSKNPLTRSINKVKDAVIRFINSFRKDKTDPQGFKKMTVSDYQHLSTSQQKEYYKYFETMPLGDFKMLSPPKKRVLTQTLQMASIPHDKRFILIRQMKEDQFKIYSDQFTKRESFQAETWLQNIRDIREEIKSIDGFNKQTGIKSESDELINEFKALEEYAYQEQLNILTENSHKDIQTLDTIIDQLSQELEKDGNKNVDTSVLEKYLEKFTNLRNELVR